MPTMFVITREEAEIAEAVKDTNSKYTVRGTAFSFGREDVKPLLQKIEKYANTVDNGSPEQNAALRFIGRLTEWATTNKIDFFPKSEKTETEEKSE